MSDVNVLTQISNRVRKDLNVLQKQSTLLENSLTQFNSVVQLLTKGGSQAHRGPGRPRKEEVVVTLHRGPGRPRKEESAKVNENEMEVRRGPGRPRIQKPNEVAEVVEVKRGPGRPRINREEEVVSEVKRGPGRPRLNREEPVVTEMKRGPGRPRLNREEPVAETKRGPGRPRLDRTNVEEKQTVIMGRGRPSLQITAELKRVEENEHQFNQWWEDSNKDAVIWKIENATYLGVIEGFYSSGTTGRFGITTRVFVNPNSELVPEDMKHSMDTAAVNRIRYVDNKEEGIKYIERQKAKLLEEFFNEIAPQIIKDHGKEGSVYAFHLDADVRNKFDKLKGFYESKHAKATKETVRA